MTVFVIYLLISGLGFPITLGILIKEKNTKKGVSQHGKSS